MLIFREGKLVEFVSAFVKARGTSKRAIHSLKSNKDNVSARFYVFCLLERICFLVNIV